MPDARLRSKLIRLAHDKPELRPDLLPLLSKNARHAPNDSLLGKVQIFLWDLAAEIGKKNPWERTSPESKGSTSVIVGGDLPDDETWYVRIQWDMGKKILVQAGAGGPPYKTTFKIDDSSRTILSDLAGWMEDVS